MSDSVNFPKLKVKAVGNVDSGGIAIVAEGVATNALLQSVSGQAGVAGNTVAIVSNQATTITSNGTGVAVESNGLVNIHENSGAGDGIHIFSEHGDVDITALRKNVQIGAIGIGKKLLLSSSNENVQVNAGGAFTVEAQTNFAVQADTGVATMLAGIAAPGLVAGDAAVKANHDAFVTAENNLAIRAHQGLSVVADLVKVEIKALANDVNLTAAHDVNVVATHSMELQANTSLTIDAGNLSADVGNGISFTAESGNVVVNAAEGNIAITCDQGTLEARGNTGATYGTTGIGDVNIGASGGKVFVDANTDIEVNANLGHAFITGHTSALLSAATAAATLAGQTGVIVTSAVGDITCTPAATKTVITPAISRTATGSTEENKTATTVDTALDASKEISILSTAGVGATVQFTLPNGTRSGQRKVVRSSLSISSTRDMKILFTTNAEEADTAYNAVTFPFLTNNGKGHWFIVEWATGAAAGRSAAGWVIIAYSPGLTWNAAS